MGRKDEILEILIQKFQEEGFSMDLTMSQIAEKVDIGKSTIYEYFKSKDDIYKEAILKLIQGHIDETLEMGSLEGTFEERFKFLLKRLLIVAKQSRMMMEVFTRNFIDKLPEGLRIDMKEKMETTRDLVQDKFTTIFMKGIEEGVLVPQENPIKQELVSSLVVGAIVRFSTGELPVDVDQFIDNIFDLTIYISNKETV